MLVQLAGLRAPLSGPSGPVAVTDRRVPSVTDRVRGRDQLTAVPETLLTARTTGGADGATFLLTAGAMAADRAEPGPPRANALPTPATTSSATAMTSGIRATPASSRAEQWVRSGDTVTSGCIVATERRRPIVPALAPAVSGSRSSSCPLARPAPPPGTAPARDDSNQYGGGEDLEQEPGERVQLQGPGQQRAEEGAAQAQRHGHQQADGLPPRNGEPAQAADNQAGDDRRDDDVERKPEQRQDHEQQEQNAEHQENHPRRIGRSLALWTRADGAALDQRRLAEPGRAAVPLARVERAAVVLVRGSGAAP